MPLFGRKRTGTPLTEEQLQEIFRRHDTNGDGHLNWLELRSAFRSLGASIPFLRAGLALYCVDNNGDGFVNQEEMNALVQYASKLGYTLKTQEDLPST